MLEIAEPDRREEVNANQEDPLMSQFSRLRLFKKNEPKPSTVRKQDKVRQTPDIPGSVKRVLVQLEGTRDAFQAKLDKVSCVT